MTYWGIRLVRVAVALAVWPGFNAHAAESIGNAVDIIHFRSSVSCDLISHYICVKKPVPDTSLSLSELLNAPHGSTLRINLRSGQNSMVIIANSRLSGRAEDIPGCDRRVYEGCRYIAFSKEKSLDISQGASNSLYRSVRFDVVDLKWPNYPQDILDNFLYLCSISADGRYACGKD